MRRKSFQSTQRRVRWTAVELGLIALAALLISASAGVELFRWAQPAGSHAQEEVTAEPPTVAPPTAEPPTAEPPTVAPPTAELPTAEPPTAEPPTAEPPTAELPTVAPPTTGATAEPTRIITDPPLTLDPYATTTTVQRGQTFNYVIPVNSSSENERTIEVHNSVNSQLDVIGASTLSGTCSTSNPIICVVKAHKNAPAQITIVVRVRPDAASGSLLVSQTLARDDQNITAASERVTVVVEGELRHADVPTATTTPSPTATAEPSPTAAPAVPSSKPERPSSNNQSASATSQPSSTAEQSGVPVVEQQATAAPPAPEDARATANALATASTQPSPTTNPTAANAVIVGATATAQRQPTPALPPTLEPLPKPDAGVGGAAVLPETSSTAPAFGLGIGLFGLALTIHGARRVRRADDRLSSAGAAFNHLSPLVNQANEFQHSTINEIERMHQQSAAINDLLKKPRNKK